MNGFDDPTTKRNLIRQRSTFDSQHVNLIDLVEINSSILHVYTMTMTSRNESMARHSLQNDIQSLTANLATTTLNDPVAVDAASSSSSSRSISSQSNKATTLSPLEYSIPSSLTTHTSHSCLYNRRTPLASTLPYTVMITPASTTINTKQIAEVTTLPPKCQTCGAYLHHLVHNTSDHTIKCSLCNTLLKDVKDMPYHNDSILEYTSLAESGLRKSSYRVLALVVDASLASDTHFISSIQDFVSWLPSTTEIALFIYDANILSLYSFNSQPTGNHREFPHFISHSFPLNSASSEPLDACLFSNLSLFSPLSSSLKQLMYLLSSLPNIYHSTNTVHGNDSSTCAHLLKSTLEWVNLFISGMHHNSSIPGISFSKHSKNLSLSTSSHVCLFVNQFLPSNVMSRYRSLKEQFIDLGERYRSHFIKLDAVLNISTPSSTQSPITDVLRYATLATGGTIWANTLTPSETITSLPQITNSSITTASLIKSNHNQPMLSLLLRRIFRGVLSSEARMTLYFSSSLKISRIIGPILSYDIKKRKNVSSAVILLSSLNLNDTVSFSFELAEEVPGTYSSFQCCISYSEKESDGNAVAWTRVSTWRVPVTGNWDNSLVGLSNEVISTMILKDWCAVFLRESASNPSEILYQQFSNDIQAKARKIQTLLQAESNQNETSSSHLNWKQNSNQIIKILYTLLYHPLFTGKYFDANEVAYWRSFIVVASVENCDRVIRPALVSFDINGQIIRWPSCTLAWSPELALLYDNGLFIFLYFGESMQDRNSMAVRGELNHRVHDCISSRSALPHVIKCEHTSDWSKVLLDLLEPMHADTEVEQFENCSAWAMYTPSQRQYILCNLRNVSSRPSFHQFCRNIL